MHGRDLRSKSLSVLLGDRVVVHPIDLDVAAGEVFALAGPSGAGKTTLLRTLAGFLDPALGRIAVGGVDVTDLAPERRPTVLVPASLALFPSMSVADNVAFALEARGVGRTERRARAVDLLARVGLHDAGERRPADLADVDRRRVALARALAVEPAVLLLDEPFAGLDPDTRRRLRTEWKAIVGRTATTCLLATGDGGEALAFADRVAVIRDGRIEQVDTPDRLYARPATAFVARFLGPTNTVAGRVAAARDGRLVVETALGRLVASGGGLAVGDPVEVTIRPERLLLDPDPARRTRIAADPDGWNRLDADLVGRTLEGATVAYDVAVAGLRLTLHRPNLGLADEPLASTHALAFHADDTLAFPAPAAGGGDG